MNVDLMRRVDYFAGVPLCFAASLLAWAGRLLRPGDAHLRGQPRRVLFLELSEMGSTVLADPAMRKLRASGAELYFAIFARNAPSLGLLGTVPEPRVFRIREARLATLLLDSLRFFAWTRREGIDTVIDLELFSRYAALLAFGSGARRRVGFHAFFNEGLYRGSLLTHRVAYNAHQHIGANFIALVNAVLAGREELPYSKTRIEPGELELARAEVGPERIEALQRRIADACPAWQPGQPIALLNPNAGDLLPQRRWPPGNFAAVATALLARYPGLLVLVTGARAEREQAERLCARVADPRCVNFAGLVEFGELPALYGCAAVMLTNDSGPGHFAAVTPLRTIVLFGPETPALYRPLGNTVALHAGLACSPCVSAANHRKTPCRDNVCMQAITPEEVLGHLCEALDARA